MVLNLDPDDHSRFSSFTILTTPYKTVSDQPITTDVLIPKNLKTSTSPILLRYHGGGFVSGASLFPGPNYRLAPEASMEDILDDVEDHWKWIHSELPAFIQAQTGGAVNVDTGRILTAGDSAGGSLCLMVALSRPDQIKAVTASYPSPLNKRHLVPFDRLDDGARVPRGGVFVWHGNEDSVGPVRGSIKLDSELVFHLAVQPGEHGFDADPKIDDDWMAHGLKNLVGAWLG
ncbi:hypothetical protein DL769_005145 [Monosporascus sp. CRB-8-3]|nr:hypothetical protein DL769_005145 [Monosporascus sp. CRB-8-3]